MNECDFTLLAQFLKSSCGFVISSNQAYLAEARLEAVRRRFGYPDMTQLVAGMMQRLQATDDDFLLRAVRNAMAVHETSFMRDAKLFDYMRDTVLPEIHARNIATRQLRIWSCACATGQEPYTLAMLLAEDAAPWQGWQIEILASDMSEDVITRAQTGVYSQFEVQRGLPVRFLVKYFIQNGEGWAIHDALKRDIRFAHINLLDDFDGLGVFDIILCRNVLLYMDPVCRKDIVSRLARNAHTQTSLILGASETLMNIHDAWHSAPDIAGVYRL